MRRVKSLMVLLLTVYCLQFWGGTAESAQTINGKSLGSVDDVVREVNRGELSLPKKGLITLRGLSNNDNTYLDVFASVFGTDGSASAKRRIWSNPKPDTSITKYEEKPVFTGNNVFARRITTRVPDYEGEPKFYRPAVSRKLYNGKRALMFHNLAPNGSLKYFFKTLSNTRDTSTTDITPNGLVNLVGISDFGEYTSPKFSNAEKFITEVYGTGVMSVKGYDREIFVAASGPGRATVKEGYDHIGLFLGDMYYRYVNYDLQNEVRLEFFAISADSRDKMTQEPLTALTHETPFRDKPHIVSMAVGDFDGDKYENEVALMIHTSQEIKLFVYRLNFSDGKLSLRAMGDANGIQVDTSKLWLDYLEEQPVADMVAGDFDGDGTDEIAVLYKKPSRATALKDERGWKEGPMTGDIHCKIHKWNANSRNFVTDETTKAYNKEELIDSAFDMLPEARVAGVVGLRAAAADLDGDGKKEIVTLLLGYYHHKQWDAKIKAYKLRRDDFYVYPHLAVWTFNRGSIKPVHDEAHVKGGVESGENRYNFGPLYEYVKNQNTKLLGDKPFLEWRYIWYDSIHQDRNKNEGTSPDSVRYMYAPRTFSIAAGPFTGQIGTFRTVDDIAVSWRDRDGNDCVTIFKSKVNASKQFDGFEDGKLAMSDAIGSETWRGLVAVDLVGEGVELDKPVHLMKESQRSYIAVLNAIPYHVDNVGTDGSLTSQPINYTYSEALNGGSMTVSYGKSTTNNESNTVKQDLSQTVETLFLADPKGDNEKTQEIFGKVKGVAALTSAVSDMVAGEEKPNGEVESPLGWLSDAMEFITDKVERINEQTNNQATTTTIDKEITATTYDAILYTNTARHIWRYPVMTRPLPMWLARGSRVDSTPVASDQLTGDKELYLTFTMSENGALRTSSSVDDNLYEPLHEEGNFFSYPSQVADVEGYNDAGLLTGTSDSWTFGTTLANTGITFTNATSDMQHTETKVTPSTFTATASFIDRLINGKDAKGINMPDTDNPKTFSKSYSKTERISYSLQASSTLYAAQAAGHEVTMQPFVAKEGAMTLGTAVNLTASNSKLWNESDNGRYWKYPDPALYLPMKFVKDGETFSANTYDRTAMKIRGIRFYVPDFAFYSDNRLMNGLKYEIRVPLYNASFKATGDFKVRLSYSTDNSRTAAKTLIQEITVPSIEGWDNNRNSNKGTAVFEWTPNVTSNKKATNKQYYFYVEIDPDSAITEVHEGRYGTDGRISDYGGNNTGFYPFYVYDYDDAEASGGTVVSSGMFSVAADEIQLTPLYFTDGDDNRIEDMAAFMMTHSDDSFVTITANFNYSGTEAPYGLLLGCLLTQSGRQKIPGASLNTIVDLSKLETSDISDVFTVNDIALFNGLNQVTFTVSPSELLTDEVAAVVDSATFGVMTLTDEEVKSIEEFYEGEDPSFDLPAIPDNIVSSATSEVYTLTASRDVFWKISSVKLNGTSASDEEEDEDDRGYLDIELEALETDSEDVAAPSDYGETVVIMVSSIAGYTPKGEYELRVQNSPNCEDWTDAGVLKFDAENEESPEPLGSGVSSSSGGCNAGLGVGTLAFVLSGLVGFRKKSRQ